MSKLTLSVDPAVISCAKSYARRRGVSVSELVETYLAAVSGKAPPESKQMPPVLRSLRGSLKNADLRDHKKFLASKYR